MDGALLVASRIIPDTHVTLAALQRRIALSTTVGVPPLNRILREKLRINVPVRKGLSFFLMADPVCQVETILRCAALINYVAYRTTNLYRNRGTRADHNSVFYSAEQFLMQTAVGHPPTAILIGNRWAADITYVD